MPLGGPLRPPIRNTDRAPITKSIGVGNVSLPPHIVAIQLKNLIPVGTATSRVVNIKGTRRKLSMPEVNM